MSNSWLKWSQQQWILNSWRELYVYYLQCLLESNDDLSLWRHKVRAATRLRRLYKDVANHTDASVRCLDIDRGLFVTSQLIRGHCVTDIKIRRWDIDRFYLHFRRIRLQHSIYYSYISLSIIHEYSLVRQDKALKYCKLKLCTCYNISSFFNRDCS